MPDEVVEKYGILFPAEMPEPLIELKCWKHWREPSYREGDIRDPWECFWRGVYGLLPRDEFVRHTWAEQHVYDWTTEDFVITWGCASSGKSNDYGLITLLDWWTDPQDTVSILASTTLNMLKLRSFESVVRYFHKIRRYAPFAMPGRLSKTTTAVLLDEDDDVSVDVTDKASIRGVAVSEGAEEEARSKLQGAHLPYVRLILDELAQMRPAAMSVRTNLAIGARNFKLVGLCNIDSFTDLAGRHCIPDSPNGYEDLDPDSALEWRSQFGKVRRHDGLQSPAILEENGATKYPFLLNKETLDNLLKQVGGNWDDPQLWTMVRAWPPMQGKQQTLLTMVEAIQGNALQKVEWYDLPAITVLGVDPAFSEDGNRPVIQPLQLGYDKNLQLRISCLPKIYMEISASSPLPITAQVSNQVAEVAKRMGVSSKFIGVDDAATQSVADWLHYNHGMIVQRFCANSSASQLPIAVADPQKADERYYNLGTELWAAAAGFIRAGQLRSIDPVALNQLVSRPTEPDKRPLRLVSKKRKVKDGGSGSKSPDDMDALGFAVGVVRFVLNIFAGATRIPEKYVVGEAPVSHGGKNLKHIARKYDLDSRSYGRT